MSAKNEMFAWVLDILPSFITVLQRWQAQAAMGERSALASFFGAIVVPVGGFFLFARRPARRRY